MTRTSAPPPPSSSAAGRLRFRLGSRFRFRLRRWGLRDLLLRGRGLGDAPEVESEPPAGETAARHKRRFRECRRALTLAGIVLTVLWLPWLLEQLGMTVPFFSESAGNAALCVAIR